MILNLVSLFLMSLYMTLNSSEKTYHGLMIISMIFHCFELDFLISQIYQGWEETLVKL